MFAAVRLRQEVARPDDRPGDKVREKENEEQEVRQAPLGRDFLPKPTPARSARPA